MPKISITYASADRYFVDLLAELLRYHHLEIWHDFQAGEDARGEADKSLAESEYLIVVVSKNSRGSEQVSREILSFQAGKGRTAIIPVSLDDTNPDQVFDGLRDIQGIPFHESMLTGFQSLLKVFGKEFLPGPSRRKNQDRRERSSRRIADRRNSPVIQRLRNGLWKLYERETGSGKFDAAYLTLGERLKAIDILQNELNKYDCFTKDGQTYRLSKMDLDMITNDVWHGLGNREHLTAVIVMEAVAEKTLEQFTLKPIDRRDDDRRAGAERRGN